MAQLLGEALTLRAVIYLDLVKAWGDVPARFEPITTETLLTSREVTAMSFTNSCWPTWMRLKN